METPWSFFVDYIRNMRFLSLPDKNHASDFFNCQIVVNEINGKLFVISKGSHLIL